MRHTVLVAATAFVIGGVATGALLATAQPAPPPPVANVEGPPPPPPWMHRMHGPHPGGMMMQRPFALVFRQADRQLAPADVQKIAEAFLLWNGNHSWKIVDVAATPEGPIAFAMATADGTVIARFTMDAHTGKIVRMG
jgi:hypothetical protein